MFKPIRTSHPVFKILNISLVDLPAPNNISIWWNYGSLLGLCLILQTVTGIFLTMHYAPNIDMAFASINHISRDVSFGWMLRACHANGGSMFFLFLYLHTARGMYYNSFIMMPETWTIGVTILLISMATAFMGYVLPWGQMSFWAATVITNLLSAIPYIGQVLVEWVWGGFAVDSATLNRFFAFHFMLPFVVMALSAIHILFLHQTGSNNPIGVNSDADRVPFHPYYTIKDLLGYVIALAFLAMVMLFEPNVSTDPENFINANPLVTPTHIKPEWYFLWMYAVLRAIPNKLGGVIALFGSVLILYIMPLSYKSSKLGFPVYPLSKLMFWLMVSSFLVLTWIGGRPVEDPYILIGQIFTALYFSYFVIAPSISLMWDHYSLKL